MTLDIQNIQQYIRVTEQRTPSNFICWMMEYLQCSSIIKDDPKYLEPLNLNKILITRYQHHYEMQNSSFISTPQRILFTLPLLDKRKQESWQIMVLNDVTSQDPLCHDVCFISISSWDLSNGSWWIQHVLDFYPSYIKGGLETHSSRQKIIVTKIKVEPISSRFPEYCTPSFQIKSKQLLGLTFTNLKQCVQSLLK